MKKILSVYPMLLLLITIFLMPSCETPQKLLQVGEYDEAVVQAVRKLRKKKKKRKHVEVVEAAFRKVTEKDMRHIDGLKAENRPENWTTINQVYRKIQNRQELIEPYLPLYASDGYKAEFKFVRVAALELESREAAAEYLYVNAKNLLQQATQGDKLAARSAYNELCKIDRYFDDYQDKKSLKEKALLLGMNKVLVNMDNQSGAILPPHFERDLLGINVRDMNDRWTNYYTNSSLHDKYDYHITMSLQQIDISPERINERQYVETKEVKDGFDYVLDANGNVMKDTLGNDLTVDRYKLIYATVFENQQHKAARVSGRLDFYDNYTNEIIRTEPISVEAIFENYALRYEGDRKALSKDTKRNIGNSPQPFPSDAALVLEAADHLKPAMKSKIKRCADYVMR